MVEGRSLLEKEEGFMWKNGEGKRERKGLTFSVT